MTAAYLLLSGEALAGRAEAALDALQCCELCARRCRVDRTAGELGFCRTGRAAPVASSMLHFGEEEPLVGGRGSGAVFFAGCNLHCCFCQNCDISRDPAGFPDPDAADLARVMLELQAQGAANINLVSPSHVVAQILEALPLAASQGLTLPLVYNTGGYDSEEALRLLDGVVDIYMPDVKFGDPTATARYLAARDYPEVARRAVLEMHRQVGDLQVDGQGLARRGLLVRHLVMPGGLAGTGDWMRFLARDVSADTYVNIMDQYRPCAEAGDFPELDRPISSQEYREAVAMARAAGITRFDRRGPGYLARLLRALSEEA